MVDQQFRTVHLGKREAIIAESGVEIGAFGQDFVAVDEVAGIKIERLPQRLRIGGLVQFAQVDVTEPVAVAGQDVEPHLRPFVRTFDQVRANFADDLAIVIAICPQQPVEDFFVLARPCAQLPDIGLGIAIRLDRGEHLELVDELIQLGERTFLGWKRQFQLIGQLDHARIDQQRPRLQRVVLGELGRAVVGDLFGVWKLERIGPFDGQPGNLCQRAFGRQIDIFASKGIGAIDGRWLFGRHAIGCPAFRIVDRLVRDQRFEFGIGVAILRVCNTRLTRKNDCERRKTSRTSG